MTTRIGWNSPISWRSGDDGDGDGGDGRVRLLQPVLVPHKVLRNRR